MVSAIYGHLIAPPSLNDKSNKMINFICINKSALINSVGLLFDIAGAFFVGNEVVHKFKGEQFKRIATKFGTSPAPEKTKDFSHWEQNKYINMRNGLFLLVTGFILQIASNWM